MRNIFFVLFLLFSFGALAQKEIQYSNTPLSDVLAELEGTYEVKFSYNSAFIAEKQVSLQITDTSLAKILDVISRDLNVVFDKVGSKWLVPEHAKLTEQKAQEPPKAKGNFFSRLFKRSDT